MDNIKNVSSCPIHNWSCDPSKWPPPQKQRITTYSCHFYDVNGHLLVKWCKLGLQMICTFYDEQFSNLIYNYKLCLCVRASDDVLGAFSVAEPTTEIFYGRTGHRDHDHRLPATQVLRPRSWEPNAAAPAPKMARITNSVITHRSSGLTNGGKLN